MSDKLFQTVLALTIFVGAFLLFFVQPLIARQLLPVFGGAASVWLACLLFFQTFLLFGYCYAHFLRVLFSPRWQSIIHLLLLLASLVWIYRGFAEGGLVAESFPGLSPLLTVLVLLTNKIGGPFLLLAGTSPLIQNWFGLRSDQPYRLYALSNVGSLLALLCYPFIEPLLSLSDQATGWIFGFGLYLILMVLIAIKLYALVDKQSVAKIFNATIQHRLIWTGLSACGAMLLLSTSNVLIREVAPVPLLWVLPLAIYLCTFILTFDKPQWYNRLVSFGLLAISLIFMMFLISAADGWSLALQVFTYGSVLFFSCLICHGEMVRLRPEKAQLTEFYLFLSLGGVVGAVFVNVLAPSWFDRYLEFEVALVLAILLAGFIAISSQPRFKNLLRGGLVGASCALVGFFVWVEQGRDQGDELLASRSFYGALKVMEFLPSTPAALRSLISDGIHHGSQLTNDKYRKIPTTYFSYKSGVGVALINSEKRNRKVGIVGLGAGTLATYGNSGDEFRFYEINPDVIDIAGEYFGYLRESSADISIVEGDARVMLQLDLEQGLQFDVLIIDAFSGDAIPTHLLTEEAWAMYWQILKPDGILAIHLSNKYLDLIPIVQYHNNQQDYLELVQVSNEDDLSWDINAANWLIQTGNQAFLRKTEAKLRLPASDKAPVRWSDQKSSVTSLFF